MCHKIPIEHPPLDVGVIRDCLDRGPFYGTGLKFKMANKTKFHPPPQKKKMGYSVTKKGLLKCIIFSNCF